MKIYGKKRLALKRFLFCFFYTLFIGILIYIMGNRSIVITTNIANVKSLQSYEIKPKDKKESQEEEFNGILTTLFIDNVNDIEFNCLNKQLNDDFTYEDNTYGNLQLILSNNTLLCGSIIKISTIEHDYYGIIISNKINVLNNNFQIIKKNNDTLQNNVNSINIAYKIERLGY